MKIIVKYRFSPFRLGKIVECDNILTQGYEETATYTLWRKLQTNKTIVEEI